MQQDLDRQMLTESSRMDIRKFLCVLLHKPDTELDLHGQYVEIRLIGQAGKPMRHFLPADALDLEAHLAEIVEQAMERRSNVYVGLALRDNDKSGRDGDCSQVTLLVVDHDEADGVKIKDIKDTGEREAARKKILEKLQNETDRPPTMIVDSGNGYHAYYALDAAVNVRELAEAIKRKSKWLAQRYSDCPGDPAMQRISQPIRLPGSLNVKNPNAPLSCQIVEYHPERIYVFTDIPEVEIRPVSPKRALQVVRNSQVRQFKHPFWDCALLCWMREHPAEQSYHLWMASGNTCAYFGEAGREAFHELSREYPGYSEDETNAMFDKMLASFQKGIGPVTYAKLAEYGFTQPDDPEAASPAIYIEHLWQDTELAAMGIAFDQEKGKMTFNANVFAEYFLSKHQLLFFDDKMFYEYQDGVWRPLSEIKLMRRIWDMFQSVKKNLYRSWFGTDAVTTFKLAAKATSEMDMHKHLLNLVNGMLDITTFELLPHSPDYLSTVQIPLVYDPNAKCERFEQFVDEIMESDLERVKVLQEIIGYLLTAEMTIHKGFFFHGDGSNGKSLLLDIVTMLVGPENVSNLTLQDLENSFSRSNLIGKTANIATENEISAKGFNSQYFKAIVAGDRIQVEKKYQDSISYAPICKLVFAVNNLPYSPDKTHGLYRRMLIIPFNRRFDGKQADKHLKKKLQKELAGILNWALVGLKRLREQDYEFTFSAVIGEAVRQYKKEQNPMLDYMMEMLIKGGQNDRVLKAAVIEGYQTWCRRNGLGDMVKMSPQKFWNTFKANCKESGLPYDVQTSNGIRYLKYLLLKNQDGKPSRITLGNTKDAEDLPA